MADPEHAKSFRDLVVYKKARAVAKEIFELTKTFPKEEMYSLTNQVRRPSRSIGAQIAEAWAKRRYEKHFVSKLTDADGEQLETQHWLDTAEDCAYISPDEAARTNDKLAEIGKMLNSMIKGAHRFCFSSEDA
jgi:four helix bundle protein